MARPKGSKNKTSFISSADYEKQISDKEKDVISLKSELETLDADIKDKKAAAKAIKADIRKAEKALAVLKAKKEESEAIEAATAQKEEIEKVVTELISRGRNQRILKILNFFPPASRNVARRIPIGIWMTRERTMIFTLFRKALQKSPSWISLFQL